MKRNNLNFEFQVIATAEKAYLAWEKEAKSTLVKLKDVIKKARPEMNRAKIELGGNHHKPKLIFTHQTELTAGLCYELWFDIGIKGPFTVKIIGNGSIIWFNTHWKKKQIFKNIKEAQTKILEDMKNVEKLKK